MKSKFNGHEKIKLISDQNIFIYVGVQLSNTEILIMDDRGNNIAAYIMEYVDIAFNYYNIEKKNFSIYYDMIINHL